MKTARQKRVRLVKPTFDYKTAFCRNEGLISPEEQDLLKNATVGIPGMGGVGGVHLIALARLGFGGFKIADADEFSLGNFNRQYGADIHTIGKSKAKVMEEKVLSINPDLRLTVWDKFLDTSNIDKFLDGVDVIIDSLDAFATDIRFELFTRAREQGIPVVSAGPIGFSCSMVVFTPDSMPFEKYFNFNAGTPLKEQFIKFILGLSPKLYFLRYLNTGKASEKEKRGPSVASAVQLCAGFAATEAVKLVLGRGKVYATPHFYCFDPYLMKFKVGYLPFGNRNWIQRVKFFFTKRLLKD